MDHKEAQEIRWALCMHDELIQCNRSSLFLVTSKVHKNEQGSLLDPGGNMIASMLGDWGMYLTMLLKLMPYGKVFVLQKNEMSLKLWFWGFYDGCPERSSRKLRPTIMSSTTLSPTPSLLLKASKILGFSILKGT
jgi:hypothetical protein